MFKLALIGKNISHSLSPQIYNDLLNGKVEYQLLDFNCENEIPPLDIIFRDNLNGLSITAPYKKHFLSQVEIVTSSETLSAINCIRKKGGYFQATNTDFLALKEILERLLAKKAYQKVLLLGSGSMAEVSKSILNSINQPFDSITRSSHGNLERIDLTSLSMASTLVLNSCSRTMQFTGKLSPDTTFYDFNYSMKHAVLISDKKTRVNYIDGEELLYLQAKYALDFWGLS